MPDKLFYTTQIPVCIWILNRNKKHPRKTLFIDARKFGQLVTRKLRELTDEDIRKIADTYINWQNNENYEDVQGFCKSATIDDIREHNYILTPGRYVGIEEEEEDGESFEEKMERLTATLAKQFLRPLKISRVIRLTISLVRVWRWRSTGTSRSISWGRPRSLKMAFMIVK
ncbi:N-6 DNA Methylase [Geobacillus sp. BCO2]|nr:N-6 DNA Methylase [Geobacillus sp. BCO2]